MQSLRAVFTIIVVLGCGGRDPVELPPRGTHHIVMGSVMTSSGNAVSGAKIKSFVVAPYISGPFQEGGCKGLLNSQDSTVTAQNGGFSLELGSMPSEDTLCIAIKVAAGSLVPTTHTIPKAFFRGDHRPPDTTRISIVSN
jgi:hypothetical protein